MPTIEEIIEVLQDPIIFVPIGFILFLLFFSSPIADTISFLREQEMRRKNQEHVNYKRFGRMYLPIEKERRKRKKKK